MLATRAGRRGRERVFFVGPASRNKPTRRANLTLHWSDDGGATWPGSLLVHTGPSGYSSLAPLGGGDLGLLFEGGKRKEHYAKRVAFVVLRRTRADKGREG